MTFAPLSPVEKGAEITGDSALTLRLFGRFEAYVDGSPLVTLHSRHEHLLLALLALERGSSLHRSIIGERLWSPDEHSSYRIESNLRRVLTNLRKSLGAQAERLPDPRSMSRTLSLDLCGTDVDVVQFDDLIARRDPVALEQAVALYRGPLLMEYSDTQIMERQTGWLWILEERRKRQQAFRNAITELSVRAQVGNNYALAAERLRLAIEADKYWQPGYRLLMETLAKVGQPQEALAIYDRLCKLLRRENRDGPGDDIMALAEKIRRDMRSKGKAPPTPRATPPLKGNLPVISNLFVERENDGVQIIAYLQSQRLVTLTGTGGVGKTRLSVRIGQELKTGIPDGVWFIDLSALNPGADAVRVAVAVADIFRPIITPRESEPLKGLVEFLADKTMLLILDNCEHLVEGVRPVVTTLLRSCAGLRILATSRQLLGISGEVRWHVPSLLTPDPRRLPQRKDEHVSYVESFPAVTLFLARAEAARPSFRLNQGNAQAVAEICHRLDGIPLALELAAARLQSISVADLVTSLDDLFAPDAPGYPVPRERQRTLRYLMDWSYDLLQEQERKLLMRLAVFRGGWTRESAAAVCADPSLPERQVRTVLTRLVEKSLVNFEELSGEGRYRLFETIRQYALETLIGSGELDELKLRHLAYFSDMAERAEPKLRGCDQEEWYRRLEVENENLRAALEYAFDESDGASAQDDDTEERWELGLGLAGALWHFWEMRSVHAEGYKWLRTALKQEGRQGIARARALIVSAVVADDFCEGSLRIPLVEEGVALARRLGNRWWTGFGLLILGWIYRPIDRERSREYWHDALRLARGEADPWLITFTCHVAGYQELEENHLDVARQLFQEALAQVRRARDMWMLEETVYHLGLLACAEGAQEEALHHLGECFTLQSKLGTRTRSGTIRYFKGGVHLCRGEWDKARELFWDSLKRAHEFGNRRTMTAALRGLASVAMADRQPERAAILFGAAAGLHQTLDTPLLPVWDAHFDDYNGQTRAALGEEIFSVLAAQGHTMPIELVLSFAAE